jgi:hypothetical protein
MKLEMSLFEGALLLGMSLLSRAQVQGFEAALFYAVAELGVRGIRAGSRTLHRFFPSVIKPACCVAK